MKYFLVRGCVKKSEYMDGSSTIDDIRLVVAEDPAGARTKYYDWWESKSRDYETSYFVEYAEVLTTIE